MQNTTQMQAMRSILGLGLGFLLAGSLLGGCGIGGQGGEGSSSAALLSGLPKCDPSLLHPRIAVGAAAGLPGKLIVYVDGVMACVDDAGHVDQLLTQLEAHGASLTLPTATTPAGSAASASR
jgi:hypothetical protein